MWVGKGTFDTSQIKEVLQRLRDAVKNLRPITAVLLPEQPHRRVPGAILAVEKPTPIRYLF